MARKLAEPLQQQQQKKKKKKVNQYVETSWNVMAHAQKPDFVFQRNGRVHLNRGRGGASVQSTTGSRGVRISCSNAGYTMFRGSVKGTGYPLHSPVSPSLPLPCVTVCHHILTGVYFNVRLCTAIPQLIQPRQWSVSWRIATADQPLTSFAWRRASRLRYSLKRKFPLKEERKLHNIADINRNVTVELIGGS